jgi:hypothetical protein
MESDIIYFMTCNTIISTFHSFFNVVLAAKQNQKFPFHFLSAPPTPPAEERGKEGKFLGFARASPRARPRRNRSVRFSPEPSRAPRVPH